MLDLQLKSASYIFCYQNVIHTDFSRLQKRSCDLQKNILATFEKKCEITGRGSPTFSVRKCEEKGGSEMIFKGP